MCAGWVCYAEKTHGEWILPYLSTAKSPQAVAGSLIKGSLLQQKPANALDTSQAQHVVSEQPTTCCQNGGTKGTTSLPVQPAPAAASRDRSTHSIYHVAIMPCPDKKLEAARADFTTLRARDAEKVVITVGGQPVGEEFLPETDCVLTTSELQNLLQERDVALGDVERAALDDWVGYLPDPNAAQISGRGHVSSTHTEPSQVVRVDGNDEECEMKDCCSAKHSEIVLNSCCKGGGDVVSSCGGVGATDSGCQLDSQMKCIERDTKGECGASGYCGTGCVQGDKADRGRVSGVRGGSGGYLEYTIKHAALELFGLVRSWLGNCFEPIVNKRDCFALFCTAVLLISSLCAYYLSWCD